jgi:tetratricopeptide (TPR) repeat protein
MKCTIIIERIHMHDKSLFQKLFTENELKDIIRRASHMCHSELEEHQFRMAAFYNLDVAHAYDLLDDIPTAHQNYELTIQYLNQDQHQPIWVRLECLYRLGNHEEALEAGIKEGCTESRIALLHENAGKYSEAQKLYETIAQTYTWKPEYTRSHLFPLFLQHHSDIWIKAQNMEKALYYNEKAREKWEQIKDNLPKNLVPIEKGWFFEEIGHIYESSDLYNEALEYYEKAHEYYLLANTEEYLPSSETNYVDGDGDDYAIDFLFQLPEIRMVYYSVNSYIEDDLRRIKYRILNLKEKMKSEY